MRLQQLVGILLLVLVGAPALEAQLGGSVPARIDAGPARDGLTRNIGFDQRLGDPLPLEGSFVDHLGKPFSLARLDRQRPLLLVPVYFECPRLCGMVLDGVVRALRTLRLEPGRDFELVVFSIDPGEVPELARQSREHHLRLYEREGAGQGWHFLTTSDEAAIAALTGALGFRYSYDAALDEYAHAAGIVVANSERRLSHYFYGVEYSGKDLRLALVEASAGNVGSLVDSVLLFCFHYDPRTGRYGLVIMNVLRIAGALTVLALAGGVGWLLRSERGRRAVPRMEGAR